MRHIKKPELRLKTLLIIPLLCVLTSCFNKTSDNSNSETDSNDRIVAYNDSLLNEFSRRGYIDSKSLKNIKGILLIPMSAGCESCLQQSMNFLKSSLKREDIYFVLVCESPKEIPLIKKQYQIESVANSNVVFDKDNFWGSNQAVVTFPVMLKLSLGKVSESIDLNAENLDETFKTFGPRN